MTSKYDFREYNFWVYRREGDEYFFVIDETPSSIRKSGLSLVGEYKKIPAIKTGIVFDTVSDHRGSPEELKSKIEKILSEE